MSYPLVIILAERAREGNEEVRVPVKKCPDCGVFKPQGEFPRNRSAKDGLGTYCKPCHNARHRATVKRLYGNTRHYHLTQRFGVTAAEVEQMIRGQGGLFAICRKRPAVQVDHDHASGKVRGILCDGCNGGLGAFYDQPALLGKAIEYLRSQQ